MNKLEYLKKLNEGLNGFPQEVRKEIIADIREHFEMRDLEGITEHETALRLGDPKKLAKQFEISTKIDKAKHTRSGKDITSAVLSSAGTGLIGFFGIVIPSIIIYTLFIALLIASVCIAASGIAALVYIFIQMHAFSSSWVTVCILVSVGLIGLGILMVIGSVGLFKLFKKGILKTLEYIKKRG